jgi:hypothetical protein
VEEPIRQQILFNGKFMDEWEVDLQAKRLHKNSKDKRLFQTNELDLGGLNKSNLF